MQITTSRVVAVLTPVFAAAAGLGSAELARVGIPGLSAADLTAILVAGATTGLTAATHWLKGHRDWEKLEQEAVNDLASAKAWADAHGVEAPVAAAVAAAETDVKAEAAKAQGALVQIFTHPTDANAAPAAPVPAVQATPVLVPPPAA